MQRTVSPEILDTLAPTSPEARRSRRDLVMINWLMGNQRWMRRTLRDRLRPGDRLLELGAGAGELRHLEPQLEALGVTVTGIDLAPRPDQWPRTWAWRQEDITTRTDFKEADIVIANLVLHHFPDTTLRRLGTRMATGPRIIAACEPARRRVHWLQAGALALLGINRVTRHDALTSVRAGFLGTELPAALGLTSPAWRTTVATTLLGACRMIAERND